MEAMIIHKYSYPLFIKHSSVVIVSDNHDGQELAEYVNGQVNHPCRIPVDSPCESQVNENAESCNLNDGCQEFKDKHIR